MLRRVILGVLAVSAAIGFAGCGGSGSSSPGGGGSPQSYLYLTGASNSSYQHVWATVTKVDLVGTTGQTTNVYDGTSTGGQVIDLSSLSSGSTSQYYMLTGFAAPSGPVASANITLGQSLSVVPVGSANSVSATLPGPSGASTVLSVKFGSPQSVAATGSVVLNFNLANWTLNESTITAPGNQFMQPGMPPAGPPVGSTSPPNMVPGIYFGTVSALSGTAPTQAFTVGRGSLSVNVTTSASTVIYNSDGSASPTLAAGELVGVAGPFDASAKVVDATAIIIQVNSTTPPPAHAIGLVSADSLSANTITMQANACGGFMPSQTSLTVDVTSSTTFIDASGITDTEAQFFGNLTAGTSMVQVVGTISGSTLTATTVQILPPPVVLPITVAFRGAVSNINTTADTFTLTVKAWEGAPIPMPSVSVVTTSSTNYLSSGKPVSAATFFGGLTTTSVVTALGTLDPSPATLTATTVAIGPPNANGFHF